MLIIIFLRKSMTSWREITFMKVTYNWDKASCKMCFEVQMIRLKVMALHNLDFTSNVIAI